MKMNLLKVLNSLSGVNAIIIKNIYTATEITRMQKNYTDDSSDGTRVAVAVVHKEEEIIIILNDSASVLDVEMTVIRQ